MARKNPSRRVRTPAKPAEVTLSQGVAVALRGDLRTARDLALDLRDGEGDTDTTWLTLLRTLRTCEIVISAELVALQMEAQS